MDKRYGLPGSKYVRNDLARLLSRQNANNGSTAGGLAHVLQQGLMGYMYGQDRKAALKDASDQSTAQAAMAQGMAAQPWVNPDTRQTSNAPAGGYQGALSALSGMADNPYAGRLASQLAMKQFESDEAKAMKQWEWDNTPQQKPASIQEYEYAKQNGFQGTFQEFKAQGASGQDPSAVKEWQFFNGLNPTQQAAYLTMKRANPFVDLGDRKVQPNPAVPGTTMAEMPVGIAPERKFIDGQMITAPGIPGGQPRGTQQAGFPQTPIPAGGPQGLPAANMPGTESLPPQNMGQGGVSSVALPPSPEQVAKQEQAQQVKNRAADVVLQDIDRALGMLGESEWYNPVAGFGSETASQIAGSNAADFKALTDTIRGNIGFDRLQQMRDSSPTGGALGAISERELGTLQSVLGNLEQSQSPEQLRYNIERLKNMYLDIVHGPGNRPQVQAPQSSAGKRMRYNPATGKLEPVGGAPDMPRQNRIR